MKKKNILTIETSLNRIFISIIKDNIFYKEYINAPRSIEQDINNLLALLIDKAKIKFHDIDLILVSLGPGSFTGTRIGISVAKALSFTIKAAVIGFSNFESILHEFLANNKTNQFKKIVVLIKGPADEFYKKIFYKSKFYKETQIITYNQLLKDQKSNNDVIMIGSFINNFKIKNYTYCIPDKLGMQSLAYKNIKIKKNYYKKLDPIYIKEHYAKK